jgi:hypothetical protein
LLALAICRALDLRRDERVAARVIGHERPRRASAPARLQRVPAIRALGQEREQVLGVFATAILEDDDILPANAPEIIPPHHVRPAERGIRDGDCRVNRHDGNGCASTTKSAEDGIADAVGVDDPRFVTLDIQQEWSGTPQSEIVAELVALGERHARHVIAAVPNGEHMVTRHEHADGSFERVVGPEGPKLYRGAE